MDHAEALERMEIAAAEPAGLERLMAGDTADAAVVAGHLAGCEACAAELVRLRRVAGIARAVIAEMPDPSLRARTLAFVRANGDDRAGADEDAGLYSAALRGPEAFPDPAATEAPASIAALQAPEPEDELAGGPPATLPAVPPDAVKDASEIARLDAAPSGHRWPIATIAGIAAALLLVGVVGYGFGGGFTQQAPHDDGATTVLVEAAGTAISLATEPDTEVVALSATPAGGEATGRLVFSGTSGELVLVATGLGAPGDGAEYGCWVEAGGERRRLGTMYAAGGTAWAWSGDADGLDELPPGAVFGVSLVPADGGAGKPVLTGSPGA